MNSLSDRLESMRKSHTQKEFANKIGVPLNTYTAWLRNERLPSYDAIKKICTALGVSADWLLTGREGVSRMRETVTTSYGNKPTAPPQVHETGNLDLPLPSQWADCPVCRSKDKEIAYLRATLKSAIARLRSPRDNESIVKPPGETES